MDPRDQARRIVRAVVRHPWRTAAALLFAAAGLAFWRALPAPLFSPPYATVLEDRHGRLLGARIASDGQWRFPPGPAVPPKFRAALLAFEDRRFAWHPGVDPLALIRAASQNLSAGHIVSGGSTITMQVIRLARGNPPRTYVEKLREMLLALRLEWRHDKATILGLHATHAPFGGNVVGLEAATWRYFGRRPATLTWAEAATLAVLPNSPALIHPGRSRDRLRARRDALLKQLHASGALDSTALRLALLEPLPGRPRPLPQLAPHLLDTLHAAQPQTSRLRTTLDAGLQRTVAALAKEHGARLAARAIHNLAVLVIDNRDMSVRAYVGNRLYDPGSEQGDAIDLVRRPRSTGSILKPFLYAAMLQAGELLPDTLVGDVPTRYDGYMPENYDHDYRGAVPARLALARSLNVPAVRMLRLHGVDRFQSELQQLGMTTLHRRAEDYGLTLILGGAEGTLWDLAGLYANLARLAAGHTRLAAPRVVAGEPLQERPSPIGSGAAWLTLQALLEVNRPGDERHWRRFVDARPIAWKTGTSYGLRDGWAIGVTPRWTVAVWAGNANGEGRPGLTGTAAAAPLLFSVFHRLGDDGRFEPPTPDLREVVVCRSDGFLANGRCPTRTVLAPRDSRFARQSPHYVRIHLDASRRWRVHGMCEPVANMVHEDRFVLPPAQAHYYRRHHADYRRLPPWRPDCRQGAREARSPIELLYPLPGTRIYIPVELDGQRSRSVFHAVHRDPEAVLYWHLDDTYLGQTRAFHQFAIDAAPGEHRLVLVDGNGNRLERRFEVLGESRHAFAGNLPAGAANSP